MGDTPTTEEQTSEPTSEETLGASMDAADYADTHDPDIAALTKEIESSAEEEPSTEEAKTEEAKTEEAPTEETKSEESETDTKEEETAPGDEQDAAESKKEPEIVPEKEVPQPRLEESEIRECYELGFSVAELKAIGTVEGVRSAIAAARRLQNKNAPEPKKEEEKPSSEETKSPLDELDPDEYDPKIVALLKSQQDKIEELEKNQREVSEANDRAREADEQRQRAAAEQRFDGLMDSLDESYHDIFGKGPTRSFDSSTPQGGKRDDVLRAMTALHMAASESGTQKTEEELFNAAVEFVTGRSGVAASERKKISKDLDKNSKQITSRPASGGKGDDKPKTDAEREKAGLAEIDAQIRKMQSGG